MTQTGRTDCRLRPGTMAGVYRTGHIRMDIGSVPELLLYLQAQTPPPGGAFAFDLLFPFPTVGLKWIRTLMD